MRQGWHWAKGALDEDIWMRLARRVAATLEIRDWPFPWRRGSAWYAQDRFMLGSGFFGVVVPTVDARYVLKLTSDPSEGPLWKLLLDDAELGALPAFPAVLGVWKFAPDGYAILREAIEPLEPRLRKKDRDTQETIRFLWRFLVEELGAGVPVSHIAQMMRDFFRLEGNEEFRDIADASEVLAARGIGLVDVHDENVGRRAGSDKLVILDAGAMEGWPKSLAEAIPVANPTRRRRCA